MKLFMRFVSVFAAAWIIAGFGAMTAFSQTPNPKANPVKSKPTAAKQTAAKPKPTAPKSTDAKPKNPASKQAAAKPKTTPAKSTAAKPKPAAAKQKPAEAKPDEKTEWEKVSGIADSTERIAGVKKFLKTFPDTERKAEAQTLIAATAAELGAACLSAGDLAGAAVNFKMAASEAPVPIPDQLFNDVLSKIPANLFFRGSRSEAFEVANILEQKAVANVGQLLGIANFYLSIENGAEARRVAESAIKIDPASPAAYQSLGLANRMDFRLDESAAAYAKALELDPESLGARRGLAEMMRSNGKADEAADLYREILSRDAANLPAQTGLVLSLFDAEKRTDAEAEMAKALETNSGNVILLAGAAYWYAAHNEGEKAVSYAQKAIAADPRFIWSHIALARGYLKQNDAVSAERTLLAARRYGNFPTLEYEIASARMAAGYYREAAEELAKSFSVKDGIVRTNLGGRVPRESKDFTELIGFERRASIFAPTAADSPENTARMTALLELKQELATAEPKAEVLARVSDDFVRGDDKMKVHRQIFAAEQLLEKKAALPKVMELAKAAITNVDAGLEVANPAVAVMASQLYENRTLAATRGDFINVPEVPRQTLSAILRGEIEEIYGWALYQSDAPEDAVVRLKRAISVLPADSAWWRSSTWRLGMALARTGKDAEALDWYIRSYKGAAPNAFSYNIIEGQYKKVNGNTDGLELKIGAKPGSSVPAEVVAQKTEPTPEVKPAPTPEPKAVSMPTPESTPAVVPVEIAKPSETPVQTPIPDPVAEELKASPSPTPAQTPAPPIEEAKPSPTPEATPVPLPTPAETPAATPVPSPTPAAEDPKSTPTPEEATSPSPTPAETPESTPSPSPTPVTEEPKPTPAETPSVTPAPSPSPAETMEEPKGKPSPLPTPTEVVEEPKLTPSPTPSPDTVAELKRPVDEKQIEPAPARTELNAVKDIFPPVVITVPPPKVAAVAAKSPEAAPSPTPETTLQADAKPAETNSTQDTAVAKPPEAAPVDGRPRVIITESPALKPCLLTVSEETISLQSGGSDLAVIVGRVDDEELDGLTAVSTSPDNVIVQREPITGVRARALFVLKAVGKTGVYQVNFRLPCGRKEIVVKVR